MEENNMLIKKEELIQKSNDSTEYHIEKSKQSSV